VLTCTGLDLSFGGNAYDALYGNVASSTTSLDGKATAHSVTTTSVATDHGVPVNKSVNTSKGGPSPDSITTDETTDDGLMSWSTGPDGITSTQTQLQGGGAWTTTTSYPDGTETVAHYLQGLLDHVDQVAADGSTVLSSVRYGYDYLGRQTSMTDSTGTTSYKLRADGSLQETDYPDNTSQTVLSWDALTDQPTEVVNRDGTHSFVTYNAKGEVTSRSGGGITPTQTSRNAATGASTLTTYTGAGFTGTTATTTWQTDPTTGLLQYKQYADGSRVSYSYNGKNQLTGMDRPGSSSVYTYDAGGLQDSANYNNGEIQYAVNSRDGDGRVLSDSYVNNDQSIQSVENSYSYTADGQLQSESFSHIGDGVRVEYSYNDPSGTSPGSVNEMQLADDGDNVLAGTTYGYASGSGGDNSKRLQTVTDIKNSEAFTYAYKPNTNLISGITTSGPGTSMSTSNTYGDSTGYRSATATTAASQATYQGTYTYTSLGQRATETTTRIAGYDTSGNPITQSQTLQYSYDTQGQLTTVTDITDPESPVTLESFHLDAMGNRTSADGFSTDSAHAAMNEYTSYTTSSGAVMAITYDAHGDTTSDGKFNYTFDAQDRPVNAVAVDHSVNILYSYDAQGRLISSTRQTGWNSTAQTYASRTTTKFAYDGTNLIAEMDGSGNLLRSYLWGPGIAGSIGGLLAVTDYTNSSGPQTYRVVCDASGNVVQLIDSPGKVAANYTYSAYGIRTSATGAAAGGCNIGYQCMYADADTGMVFFPARVYSPILSIWVQRDPSGESSDVNLERYCDGDPINGRDPTGLQEADSGEGNKSGASEVGGGMDMRPPLTPQGTIRAAGMWEERFNYIQPNQVEMGQLESRAAEINNAGGPEKFDAYNSIKIAGEEVKLASETLQEANGSLAEVKVPQDIQQDESRLALDRTLLKDLVDERSTDPAKVQSLRVMQQRVIGEEAKLKTDIAQVQVESNLVAHGEITASEEAKLAQESTANQPVRLRDVKTGRYVSDPENPPSPNVMTDAERRSAWRKLASDPNSPLDDAQRAEIKARGWRGPQRLNQYGEIETMELSHEPVPLRDGGKEVVPRWPDDHAAIDPDRQLKKRMEDIR
jgi:RHS repeat-associated protein